MQPVDISCPPHYIRPLQHDQTTPTEGRQLGQPSLGPTRRLLEYRCHSTGQVRGEKRSEYHPKVTSNISYHRLHLDFQFLLCDLNFSDEDELDQLGARGGGLKGEECVDLHLAAGVLALQVRLVPVGVV